MSSSDKGIASDDGVASSNDNEYEIEDDDIDNDSNDSNDNENEEDEEEEEEDNDEDNDEDSEKDNEEIHEGRITYDVWNIEDKTTSKKLRKFITVIQKSTKVLEELKNLFVIEEKQFLRPILDCKTRWNSTYQMINRACFLKEYIQMALVRSPNLSSYFPEENEWELYKDLNKFLEQFYDATTTLSSQTYPTIAHSRIILLAIKKDLETSRGDESLLKDAINAMKTKYNEYYKKLESSSHISAFLDPRYKRYCFSEMQDNEIISPIQKLLEKQLPVTSIVPKKTSSFLQRLKVQTTNSLPIVDNEINKYWNSTDADESVKPLEWWKTHSSEYPNLAKLARVYLSIQASSVPCEQLFSIAGQVLCKSQNHLTGGSVCACICLRSWILEKF